MTPFALKDILKDVRIILGHNDLSSAIAELANDVDTLTMDEIIRREIYPAARQLLLVAPKERMEWKSLDTVDANETYVSDYNAWKVDLPSDFLRIGSAKMKSWVYPLSECTSIEELAYKKQFSDYAGLRATPKKPVMAIVEGLTNSYDKITYDMYAEDFNDLNNWKNCFHDTGKKINIKANTSYTIGVNMKDFYIEYQGQYAMSLYIGNNKVCDIDGTKTVTYTPTANDHGAAVRIHCSEAYVLPEKCEGGFRVSIENGSVTNTLQLQMFGTNGLSDEIRYVTLCTLPKIVDNNNVEITGEWNGTDDWKLIYSSTLYTPFLYMCASLVAKTLKDYNMSQALEGTANNLMIDMDAARRDARLYGSNQQQQ